MWVCVFRIQHRIRTFSLEKLHNTDCAIKDITQPIYYCDEYVFFSSFIFFLSFFPVFGGKSHWVGTRAHYAYVSNMN